jgi:hypothetical protein
MKSSHFVGLLFLSAAVLCLSQTTAAAPTDPICFKPFTIPNTGYPEGTQVTLKAGNPADAISPSFYFAWKMPDGSGGDDYRSNIGTCNNESVQMGQLLEAETGNMVGPTTQGISDLVSLDPEASYDTDRHCVTGSSFSPSPRVVAIPVFDPVYFEAGRQNGIVSLKVDGFLTVFVEGLVNHSVIARVTSRDAQCSP